MISQDLAKTLLLLVPTLSALAAFIIKPPSYFQRVGLMLGLLWNLAFLLLLNCLAIYMGWWVYLPQTFLFYGMPIDILIGWAIMWGILFPYFFEKLPLWLTISFALFLDLVAMPLLTNVFTLGHYWLVGELILLTGCLVPSLVIYKFTTERKSVGWCAFMQSIIWGGWFVFLIPAIALHFEGKSVFSFFADQGFAKILFINVMIFAGLIGYGALHEFAKVGGGTPIPFDPPQKLVTTGPYAYIGNPLQITTFIMIAAEALYFRSPWLGMGLIVLIAYCIGLVRWHHMIDMEPRFGKDWLEYKKNVPNWWPHWHPYIKRKNKEIAVIYYASNCSICCETKSWLENLKPKGLRFTCATHHPDLDLERICYRHEGTQIDEQGIHAIGRAFEHVNLGMAFVGWSMRLPVIAQILQFLSDETSQRGAKVIRNKRREKTTSFDQKQILNRENKS